MSERGRIKWFNNRAGWGFIERPGGPDIFVSHSEITGDGFKALQAGDAVEFSVRRSRRGPYAVNVVRLPAQTAPAPAVGEASAARTP